MDFIKTIVEKLKLKELFAIVFIAAISITFIPTELAQKMNIEDFRVTYQNYISLCMIIVGAYYLFRIICWFARKIRNKFYNPKRIAIVYMKKFMPIEEMEFLIENYYDERNHRFKGTAMIEYSDGRKAGLESKYVLYRASNLGEWYAFAYNLQPFAQEFLNKNLAEGNIDIQANQFRYKLK